MTDIDTPEWVGKDSTYGMLISFLREKGVNTAQYGIDSFYDALMERHQNQLIADMRESADEATDPQEISRLTDTADFLVGWWDLP